MARHPMSSSWPQLTARTSVSGQSSRLALQGDVTVRAAQDTIFIATSPDTRLPRPSQVHGAGAHRLWIGVRPRVSRRSHPAPCSAIRFQALLTLRINGRLHDIGIGGTHARTRLLLLVQPAHPRRRSRHRRTTLRPNPRPHQGLPTHRAPKTAKRKQPEPSVRSRPFPCLERSQGGGGGIRTHGGC
jgi:hypothetical protein